MYTGTQPEHWPYRDAAERAMQEDWDSFCSRHWSQESFGHRPFKNFSRHGWAPELFLHCSILCSLGDLQKQRGHRRKVKRIRRSPDSSLCQTLDGIAPDSPNDRCLWLLRSGRATVPRGRE